jgi:hypothetical protein
LHQQARFDGRLEFAPLPGLWPIEWLAANPLLHTFVSSLLLESLAIAYHSSMVLNNVHASAAAFQIQFSIHEPFRQRNVIAESIMNWHVSRNVLSIF